MANGFQIFNLTDAQKNQGGPQISRTSGGLQSAGTTRMGGGMGGWEAGLSGAGAGLGALGLMAGRKASKIAQKADIRSLKMAGKDQRARRTADLNQAIAAISSMAAAGGSELGAGAYKRQEHDYEADIAASTIMEEQGVRQRKYQGKQERYGMGLSLLSDTISTASKAVSGGMGG